MATTVMPLVSVVTPVYNNAEHLEECIASVLAQTYTNWEYTILDNCSKDASAQIARRYTARDSRIRFLQNREFLPVIRNHNAALRLISPRSKYCKMVFADDWIFPECLEKMVSVAEDLPSVGIVGCYGLQGCTVKWSGLPYPSRHVSGREIGRRHFLDRLYEFGSASSLLFRSDLIRGNDPFYNEANLHADIESCVMRLKTCDFGFVHQVLCFSRERPESISSFASEATTYKAAWLHDLVVHGSAFLNRKECDDCLHRALDDYYNFLGVNLLFGRDTTFWDYHKGMLVKAGLNLSRARLVRALLVRLCRAGLNPLETIEKALKRLRQKSRQGNGRTNIFEKGTGLDVTVVVGQVADSRGEGVKTSSI